MSTHVFCFNDTATTEIYTLSLHDALPILLNSRVELFPAAQVEVAHAEVGPVGDLQGLIQGWQEGLADVVEDARDRKSTRLNSSHANISYAVFCLTTIDYGVKPNTLKPSYK